MTDEVRRSLEALLDPDVRYRVGFVSPPKAGLNEFLAFLQMDKQVYSGWSMEVLAAAAVAPPAAAGAGNSSSGAAGGGPLPAAAPQQQPSNTVLGGASGVAALATVACGGGTTDYHSTVVPPLPSSPTAALHVHARPAALGVVCEQPRSAASSTAAGQPQRHGVVYLWTLESATNTSSFRGQPPTNK